MRDKIKRSAGQMTRLECFVQTLQEQDDTMFLLRKVVKWLCFFSSVFICGVSISGTQTKGLELSTVIMGMNASSVGVVSMLSSLDCSVAMRRGVVLNLYECLKYFPVGRLEIYMFLRKRLLRFLYLYGGLAVSLRLIIGAMTGSLGVSSLIFPLCVWFVLALVGFSSIRVRMAWRYRKKIRSL